MHVLRRAVALAAIGLLPMSVAAAGSPPAGDAQTPIDIRDDDVTFVDVLPPIRFRYPDVSLEVVNTGSPGPEATVRADVTSPASIRVAGTTYRLLQFHFHTPSEHRLAGEEFPLELHLVHRADDGQLLVLGVLIEPGRAHRQLRRIFRDLPSDGDETRQIRRFDLGELIPDGRTYRYTGSLTTPPYTEGVRWMVFDEPLELSGRQIEAFQALFPDGNGRELQALDGRPILSDVEQDG